MSRIKTSVFGAKVIGQKAFDAQVKHVAERRNKFGPLVLGDLPAKPGTATPAEGAKRFDTLKMSVEEVKGLVQKNPYLVTKLLEKEIYRPRGARVAVLEALREAIPVNWVQGDKLRTQIDALLSMSSPDSGVVYSPQAELEANKTARAMRAKGWTEGEDGKWHPPPEAARQAQTDRVIPVKAKVEPEPEELEEEA